MQQSEIIHNTPDGKLLIIDKKNVSVDDIVEIARILGVLKQN